MEAAAPAGLEGGMEAALRGLAQLAGLAPNEVLLNRIRRAGRIASDAALVPPALADPAWAALLDAVTVQETRMFRAAGQVAAFRDAVLPQLVAGAGGRPLTLVSAGCATGEEAWTLAVLGARAGCAWRVVGLDLCRPALALAEAARYRLGPPDALREVPAEDRAMLEIGAECFEPARPLRPHVAFRRANLLEPGLKPRAADAIFCRNVLIYLTEEARGRVVRALAAALRPGGALLLGPTDSPPRGLGLVPWSRDSIGLWRREDDRG
jgi:chemotaxis protein methyltransferase CheR